MLAAKLRRRLADRALMPRKLLVLLLRRLERSPLRTADRVRLDLERELIDFMASTPAERRLRLGIVVARHVERTRSSIQPSN